MTPALAAIGSATVAVRSQSSGVAAIFLCHEAESRGLQQLCPLHVALQTAVPWLLLLY